VPDGFDVRFHQSVRDLARGVGAAMSMNSSHTSQADSRARLARILDTNRRLRDDNQRLRESNEDLHLLLRSALWELARANNAPSPSRFVADWYRDRGKQ